MRSLKVALFAGAALAAAASAASAADLPPIMQRPMAPVQVEEFGGWYLRGDVGVGSQSFKSFDHTQTNQAFVWPASWRIDQQGIGDTFFVGGGIGYQFNSWLRFDATAEYRGAADLHALGSYTEFCPGGRCFDKYDGKHSAVVVMANAYIDLGTWWCLTPFVGAGAGFAQHRFTNLGDVGYISDGTTGFGYAQKDSEEWKFAWALHAGVAYNVSQNVKMEFAYRYLNFGSINTPVIDCASGGCATGGGPAAYYTLRDYSSHDFKLGVRWMLSPDVPQQPVYMPPLVRKG